MKEFIKMAFRPGRLIIASGFIAFLILIGTQKVLAVTNNDYPYLLKVNRVHNTITVYSKDANGKYSIPFKAIVCSVGGERTQTVLGAYKTKARYRWKELMGHVYGQYSTRIVGGILFHSVYYYENGNPATLATKEYNKLGSAASHGCIRLTVEDAKWIYDNCPVGTTVIIYDDESSPGPLGKPEAIKLPAGVRWDPTDPSNKNPYKNKKPAIQGVKNHTVSWGSQADLRDGVTAKSTVGTDITKHIILKGSINIYKAGTYNITYTVTDALGRTASKKSKVTVEESPSIPVFEGVRDQVVRGGTELTPEFVLSGITVTCGDILLDNQEVEITITSAGQDKYLVIYRIKIGDKVSAESSTYYTLDGEAPVFTGIGDRILMPGQVPDEAFALSGVTVSDNYSAMGPDDIRVTIEEIKVVPNLNNEIMNESEGGAIQGKKTSISAEDVILESEPGVSEYTSQNGSTNVIESGTTDGNSTSKQEEKMPDDGMLSTKEEEALPIYLITYTAEDEVGNVANVTVIFHY